MPQLFPNCPACQFIAPVKERNIDTTIPASNIASAAVSTQQKIWNTVRVPASEYTMNRAALHVYTAPTLPIGVNWNQYSDRAVAGVVHANVPSHASSTHRSITRCRPGSTSAPGAGVDVKHGSYDRYLARLKGRSVLRTQAPAKAAATPLNGNKTQSYGVAYHTFVKCPCAQ
jgi:hypothetical protein